MTITLRGPTPRDWDEIARLSDAAVSHIAEAPRQQEWLQCRRAFGGVRRHYVAVEDGILVGYGGIECSDPDRPDAARLFLVLPWLQANSITVADTLLAQLRADSVALQVRRVWLREYCSDTPYLEFLSARGFEVVNVYEHCGTRLVNLACDARRIASR